VVSPPDGEVGVASSTGLPPQLEASLDALTEEELAAAVPKRICLFVEPSPFTCALPCAEFPEHVRTHADVSAALRCPDVSGYNTRFRNTIAQLVAQGASVLVVTTGAGRSLPGIDFAAGVAPPATFAGATVIGAPSFGCPCYWQAPLSFALTPDVFAKVRAFKPDLIHVTSPGVMCLSAWLNARQLDVPLVMSYHTHVPAYLPAYGLGWLRGIVWALIKAAHGRAHMSLAASASLADELVRAGASPARLTAPWRKAVDGQRFDAVWRDDAMRCRLTGSDDAATSAPSDGAPATPPLLLYVGRLGAEKNVSFLRPLLARIPGAHLAIVGDGPARAELEAAFAADASTAGRVTFAGMLCDGALAAAYASSDVFLMPSETETLGFVVLEAMSSSLPVVAVAAGGIPDIVTAPGVNGYLYKPGDCDSAVAAVRRLLADGELRARVGAAARAESSNWDWAAATRNMLRAHYSLAVIAHRAGLHGGSRQQHAGASRERRRGFAAAAATASSTAKLVALRRLGGGSKSARSSAARKAGKAGKAVVRRALASL
jgi:sulfoquinovosyltransferase